MVPVVGPFLLLGVIAWVVAIGLGVGSWLGLFSWRDRWALAGALAGFGTFELFLYANGGWLPVVVGNPALAFPAAAMLFVGCGVGAAYGTLFTPGGLARPRLDAGTAEETLWLHDAVDRLRPAPLDWGLTGALLVPAAVALHTGLAVAPSAGLVLTGLAGLMGPVFGSAGLLLRRRASDRLLAEIAAREAVTGGDA